MTGYSWYDVICAPLVPLEIFLITGLIIFVASISSYLTHALTVIG